MPRRGGSAGHFKMRPTVAVFACMLLAACRPPSNQSKDKLELDVVAGTAPLTVRVKAPDSLLKLGRGKSRRWAGCGYLINWGDREDSYTPSGSDCAEGLQHTYDKPGTYTIVASIWHPGPDDGPVTDWSDVQTVSIAGK